MNIALISLHTAPDAQPGQGDAGGLNVYVRATAAELAARGHQVEIITADPARTGDPARTSDAAVCAAAGHRDPAPEAPVTWAASAHLGPGVRIHRLHTPARTKEDLLTHLDAIAAAMAGLPELADCQLLWAHYWISAAAVLRMRGAHRAAARFAVSFHTIGAVKDRDTGSQREPADRLAAEPRIAGAADLVIANTPAERGDIIDLLGAAPARVITAVPGIDHAVYTPGDRHAARRRLGLGAEPVLLAVGRMQHIKGTDVAIAAMQQLRTDLPEARLYMLGAASGTDAQTAGAMAEAAAAEPAITVLPPEPAERLADWYRAADAVLVPSRSESFGFAAAEAAACGTPVIAAAVGGLHHIVTPETGVLLHSHDPQIWAQAIARLLGDDAARQQMAAAAAGRATRFTWAHCVDTVLAGLSGAGATA